MLKFFKNTQQNSINIHDSGSGLQSTSADVRPLFAIQKCMLIWGGDWNSQNVMSLTCVS